MEDLSSLAGGLMAKPSPDRVPAIVGGVMARAALCSAMVRCVSGWHLEVYLGGISDQARWCH